MLAGLDIIFLTLSTAEFIIGMLGNVFIGLVNCSEWVKNQKISSADFILTCLAISRITQLLVSLFESFMMGLNPPFYSIYKLAKPVTLLWRITNYLAIWFTTCLRIFYLLKIAQFSYSLFLWLRWRMNRVVLAILVFALFFLLFDFLLLETLNDQDHDLSRRQNSTWSLDVSKTLYLNSLIVFSFIYLIPFLLSLTSLLLLFLSLRRHTRNVQLNSGSRDFSREAHKKAMKMVMSFFLLSTVHFSSILLTGWIFLLLQNCQVNLVVMLLSTLFPPGHSFILILGNSKLRKTALGLLWHLNHHLKMVKSLAS
nr:taste receptor type 2 member 42 [Mirounga angustirostris]